MIYLFYSHFIALVKLIISIDTASIIDWLDSFVKNAEDNVHDDGCHVNPE